MTHPAEPRQTPTTRAELERAWRSTVPGSGPQGARWARIVSVSLVAFTALAGVLTTAFQYGLPWWTGDRDSNHSFTSSEGTIRYQVHVPPTHGDDVRYPVMMAIHGCGMTDPGGTR